MAFSDKSEAILVGQNTGAGVSGGTTLSAASDPGEIPVTGSSVATAPEENSDAGARTLNLAPPNAAPSIVFPSFSPALAFSFVENFTSIFNIETIDDTDAEGAGLVYSISGGADAGLFTIDPSTGAFSSLVPFDFEAPSDANGDGVAEVQVTVTDSGGLTDTLDMTVTISDDREAPVITSPAAVTVDENQTAVVDVMSTDDEGDTENGGGLIYAITGGADQALFSIDPATGVLSFIAAPDFETPGDVGGDNTYDVDVTATDSSFQSSTQSLVVTVADVDAVFSVSVNATSAPEGDSGSTEYTFTTTRSGDMSGVALITSTVGGDVNAADVGPGQLATQIVRFTGGTQHFTLVDVLGDSTFEPDEALTVTLSNPVNAVIGTGSATVTILNDDAAPNAAPTITFPTSLPTIAVDFAENFTALFDMGATDEIDAEGAGLVWSISGGADAGLFTIDPSSGDFSAITPFDFEVPSDANSDGVAEVQVTVADSGGLTDTLDMTITIADQSEAPVITSPAAVTVDENQTAVVDVMSTDEEGDTENGGGLSYAITGGADQALFSIDPATGVLSFIAAPDFETPGDLGGDNTYDVDVTATDSSFQSSTQSLVVTVADVNEAPTIALAPAVTVNENETAVTVATSSDPDGETDNGGGLSFAVGGGADASLFQIDPNTGALSFVAAPNFENPGDVGADNTYNLDVSVTDAGGLSDNGSIAVTVADVTESADPVPSDFATLIEGDGTDNPLQGTPGNDWIDGKDGRDDINGKDGDDFIIAGPGIDGFVRGGGGNDTFQFGPGDGDVRIFDYEVGIDKIFLVGGLTFADLAVSTSTSAKGIVTTIFTAPDGSRLLLRNVEPFEVGSADFCVSDGGEALNFAPTANPDVFLTTTGQALTVTGPGVLADDTDPDGDTLTAALQTDASLGSVVMSSDGGFTYTPGSAFLGLDSFTYLVTDGNGGSDIGTVTIENLPPNGPPSLADITINVLEDGTTSGVLMATEPDGDPVLYDKVSNPANGTATVGPGGFFTYTPDANFNGTDSFVVSAADPRLATDTATVTVTVAPVNDAPVAPNVAFVGLKDQTLSGVVAATDIDNDPLTFSKASDPANGAVSVAPTGQFTFTPTPGFIGPDNFDVLVDDGFGGTDTATVMVFIDDNTEVALTTDGTFSDIAQTFDDFAPALAAAVPGQGIDIREPATVGNQGAVTIATDGLTIRGDAPFDAAFTLASGTTSLALAGLNTADVTGNTGANHITGSDGANTLLGGSGDDTLLGGGGNDSLNGGTGIDSLSGGDGDDTVDGSNGADVYLAGDAGNDRVLGGGGNDNLQGGADNDTLLGGANNDTLLGNDGDDVIFGELGRDSLDGGAGNDSIAGGNANDTASGGADNDTIKGQGGADSLEGDAGDDSLSGGASADTLDGGDGKDTLDGGAFNDLLTGGIGDDMLLGGSGADVIFAGADNDLADGGSSADTLDGEGGDDTLDGGIGNDVVMGGSGADSLFGNSGNDTLDGGADADTLDGGAGADRLLVASGEGGDTLTGGAGSDVFDFETGFGTATIADFTGQDLIDLADVAAATTFGDLTITYGADATIDITGTGDLITLTGVTGGLTAADFLF